MGDFIDSGYSAAEFEERMKTANAQHNNANIGSHLFSGEVLVKQQDPTQTLMMNQNMQPIQQNLYNSVASKK